MTQIFNFTLMLFYNITQIIKKFIKGLSMTSTVKFLPDSSTLNEDEFINRMREKPLVDLDTSSSEKVKEYNELFAGLQKYGSQETGVNIHFTNAGAFGIANNYVKENDGDGLAHAEKKLKEAMDSVDAHYSIIRNKLRQGTIPNPKDVEIISMVEDSEWYINFIDVDLITKRKFLGSVKAAITASARERDLPDLFNHLQIETDDELEQATFPGANLKPFQQHLQGGFIDLMDIIYNAADEAGMEDLRFENSTKIAFGFNSDGAVVNIESTAAGKIISREMFNKVLDELPVGKAIFSDSVHIPDGQANDAQLTFAQIDDNYIIKSPEELPLDHFRRNFAVWLQEKIGTREFTEAEKAAPVKIAYVTPSSLEGETELTEQQLELCAKLANDGFVATHLPTYDELRKFPNIKMLDGADILLVTPEEIKEVNDLKIDPNLSMLYYLSVNKQVDPNSVNVPIILDNRDKRFDASLELFRQATRTGRIIGDFSFVVAESDEELETLLNEYKAIVRQSKIVPKSEDITPIPDDGIMSVFVAGGHANNNAKEREEAIAMGKFLASQNIRIVTGGGQIDGSMGGVHTGFVQYHLDKAQNHENFASLPSYIKEALHNFNYDAENLILDRPDVIDALAEAGIIPAKMFISYSTEALMKMENPNGQLKTAGGIHQNVGNRLLRMDNILPADISLIFPGSTGSYEEIDNWVNNWVRNSLDDKLNRPYANDNNQKPAPQMVIYNEEGYYDAILQSFGLMNADRSINEGPMQANNILIINDWRELHNYLEGEKTNYPNTMVNSGNHQQTIDTPVRETVNSR